MGRGCIKYKIEGVARHALTLILDLHIKNSNIIPLIMKM
jgi:hypothetical protein